MPDFAAVRNRPQITGIWRTLSYSSLLSLSINLPQGLPMARWVLLLIFTVSCTVFLFLSLARIQNRIIKSVRKTTVHESGWIKKKKTAFKHNKTCVKNETWNRFTGTIRLRDVYRRFSRMCTGCSQRIYPSQKEKQWSQCHAAHNCVRSSHGTQTRTRSLLIYAQKSGKLLVRVVLKNNPSW